MQKAKGAKGKCDTLWSQLIRAKGACERCGHTTNLQAAHIVSRRYNRTRHMLENGMCLCASCHRKQHDGIWFPNEIVGQERVDMLRELLQDHSWKKPPSFFEERKAELEELWAQHT